MLFQATTLIALAMAAIGITSVNASGFHRLAPKSHPAIYRGGAFGESRCPMAKGLGVYRGREDRRGGRSVSRSYRSRSRDGRRRGGASRSRRSRSRGGRRGDRYYDESTEQGSNYAEGISTSVDNSETQSTYTEDSYYSEDDYTESDTRMRRSSRGRRSSRDVRRSHGSRSRDGRRRSGRSVSRSYRSRSRDGRRRGGASRSRRSRSRGGRRGDRYYDESTEQGSNYAEGISTSVDNSETQSTYTEDSYYSEDDYTESDSRDYRRGSSKRGRSSGRSGRRGRSSGRRDDRGSRRRSYY